MFFTLLLLVTPIIVEAVVPRFHENTKMNGLRVPASTDTGTIIYRLRAEDRDKDYPLTFNIRGLSNFYLFPINFPAEKFNT